MQDSICELSDHGMVITVEERGCLQARVYFRKEVRLANECTQGAPYIIIIIVIPAYSFPVL